MIIYVAGNLFDSPAEVLVNTVNTVGVMGKGIAKEFKAIYPEMFSQYQKLCENRQFLVGTLWLYKSPHKWVLNFPTKEHWRQPSTVEYVKAGLEKFAETYADLGIHNIAFPALGCGNGELDFDTQVQPLMEKYLNSLPIDIFVYLYEGDPFVEHRAPEDFREWLRSQPGSLAFDEVWQDLVDHLKKQSEFHTVTQNKRFTARLVDGETAVHFESAAGRSRTFAKDDFLQVWQQIREYGYLRRDISPIYGSDSMFFIGLLEHLPYMRRVQIAETYPNFAVGLQYDPIEIPNPQQPVQLSLF